MAISSSAVVKIISSRLQQGTDTTLTAINQVISDRGINATEALDIALQVGDILLSKGKSQEDVVTNIISAYKAAAYQLLLKAGVAFQNDPGLHERLNKFFQEVRALIKSAAASTAGGLGGLTGGGIPGASLSVSPAATVSAAPIDSLGGIPVGNAISGIPVTPPTAGIVASPLDALVAGPAPTAAPAQPVTQPVAAQPTKVSIVKLNGPVTQIAEVEDLETYAEHELSTSRERTSVSAKEANEKVTEYMEHGNWTEALQDLLSGKTNSVYYAGADILVRTNRITRRYLANPKGDSEIDTRISQFISQHESLLSNMDDLYGMDDAEKIMKLVVSTVNGMKANVVSFYSDMLKEGVSTETIAAEITRFTNVILGTMSIAVHNALSLGTNRCQSIPTNPRIELERNMDDLSFFSEVLYEKTTGENGYSTEPDFFRELFMLVGSSLRKVLVKYTAGELIVRHETADIAIAGNYPTMKRYNVIGKQSLGATHDPVTTIFEEFARQRPDVNVFLKAGETYLLLSTGENTSPIYY